MTETETDASSVAPEDAGLDPGALYEEEYGYGYDGDGWADWGNDAYLVYDAADNDREIGDGGSDGASDELYEGDTTLTMTNAHTKSAHTLTPRERHDRIASETPTQATADKGKSKEMGESMDELLARGMPDYASWELKRLQVGSTDASIEASMPS